MNYMFYIMFYLLYRSIVEFFKYKFLFSLVFPFFVYNFFYWAYILWAEDHLGSEPAQVFPPFPPENAEGCVHIIDGVFHNNLDAFLWLGLIFISGCNATTIICPL